MATQPDRIDEETAWAACLARDRAWDGRFVYAVTSTGVYCRPGCGARHPRRDNVVFLPDGTAARRAGFRPCLRCRPDDSARDKTAVAVARTLLEQGYDWRLDVIAAQVGYAPHHFQRVFKRATGLSPAAYGRAVRAGRLAHALSQKGTSVTDAIYDAGYEAPSRAYADAAAHLGMSPGQWKKGGQGAIIRHCIVTSSLGPVLVAATAKGLCRIAFDEGEADLRARFPLAQIEPGDKALADMAAQVVALIEDPETAPDLPVDVTGTAFQRAVWAALRAIPAGETRSYAQIAAAAGNPTASRAAGSACGDNALAVLVPCHRVVRGDGGLGGYAWGLERKRALLDRESGL